MKTITPEMSAAFYAAKGAASGETWEAEPRLCFLCGEDYDDEQCPCLPVEPPCEEYDEWNDR